MLNPVKILGWLEDMANSLTVPAAEEDSTMWRKAIRAFVITLLLAVTCLTLWAFGLTHYVGIDGPAYAEDVEESIDKKITAAITPLTQEQANLRDAVEAVNETTIAILRGLYNERVRQKVRQRCDTEDPRLREDLNRQLDSIKREFFDLSGEPYGSEPRCDQV